MRTTPCIRWRHESYVALYNTTATPVELVGLQHADGQALRSFRGRKSAPQQLNIQDIQGRQCFLLSSHSSQTASRRRDTGSQPLHNISNGQFNRRGLLLGPLNLLPCTSAADPLHSDTSSKISTTLFRPTVAPGLPCIVLCYTL